VNALHSALAKVPCFGSRSFSFSLLSSSCLSTAAAAFGAALLLLLLREAGATWKLASKDLSDAAISGKRVGSHTIGPISPLTTTPPTAAPPLTPLSCSRLVQSARSVAPMSSAVGV
jgi:hypothetical protein